MIYDAYYQVTDLREGHQSMPPAIVELRPTLGGLLYFEVGVGTGKRLEWDDNDPDAFIDDEPNGALIVITSIGTMLFQKISEATAVAEA